MQHYLLIKKLSVQNANAIAGLTYGFPAITNFLGFAHALSRKLNPSLQVSLGGITVVSHNNIVHARQPKGWGDYVFALTRNPLTQQGNTAPINEEGRMNMQISLLVELHGHIAGDARTKQDMLAQLNQLIPTLRVAGGQILNVESLDILVTEQDQKQALRRLMPGFALVDRSDYLSEHYQALCQENTEVSLFDAWCDFAKLKYQATKENTAEERADTAQAIKAKWTFKPKPKAGYLVPIAAGYCAISPVYSAGEVAKVRDKNVPVVFAETAYSVAEWRSVHVLNHISEGVWRYEHHYPWYLAKSQPIQTHIPTIEELDNETFDLDY